MYDKKELVLVNDLLLAVPCYQEDVPVVLEARVNLDLSEFNLTPAEIEKLTKIMQRLTFSLSSAFSETCLAASITTEILPKAKLASVSM
jgi:hypothetical protein